MEKDSWFASYYGTHGPALTPSNKYSQTAAYLELSGVDLNNDGSVDFVMHSQGGNVGGYSYVDASGEKSNNEARLVVVSGDPSGHWQVTQIVNNVFQLGDYYASRPYIGNGVAMTWADFNGDGFMDLFLGRGSESTTTASGAGNNAGEYASRIYFNDGAGHLASTNPTGVGNPTAAGMYTFNDNVATGASFAVDWNHDGKMDVIELPGMKAILHPPGTIDTNDVDASGVSLAGQTAPLNLFTNTSSGGVVSFTTTNLLGGSKTIGSDANPVTGGVVLDLDWDGAPDLLVFTKQGITTYVHNNNAVADGTSMHFKIVDGEGINSFYGNTVQLFDSHGKLAGTQIINPQSGNQVNDSSAIVNFFGLDANETYNLVLLRNANGAQANVGGQATVGGYAIQNVNAAWADLKAGAATDAYVLTAEAGNAVNNANIGNGIVGTGYNDRFFATLGNDKYEGGGGWATTVSGQKEWSATGGMDIVDYKLAGNTAVTVDLSKSGAQNTGFGSATFSNIEGIAGGNGNDTFTDSLAGHNTFEGRGGNDTFNLINGGHDTLLYKLLVASDATGGNGSDQVNGFTVGTWEATPRADRIDLADLLVGYKPVSAGGPAHFINGVATIDAGDSIAQYLSVTHSGGNTTLHIDRDGAGGQFSPTALVTLNGVNTDLATLLANHQIVVDHG
jgi:hypothetical protein